MKTIKLLAIAMLLMSFSCTPDEVEKTSSDCDCVTTIYELPVGSGFQVFQVGLPTDNELTCEDETNEPLYYSAPNFFYQIDCE